MNAIALGQVGRSRSFASSRITTGTNRRRVLTWIAKIQPVTIATCVPTRNSQLSRKRWAQSRKSATTAAGPNSTPSPARFPQRVSPNTCRFSKGCNTSPSGPWMKSRSRHGKRPAAVSCAAPSCSPSWKLSMGSSAPGSTARKRKSRTGETTNRRTRRSIFLAIALVRSARMTSASRAAVTSAPSHHGKNG